MTYLELVNAVMRRLRERQVTAISSDYALLVGAFVNDAKKEVEKAWNWKALRTNLTFSTVSGTQDYNLGTGGVASGGTTTSRSRLCYNTAGEPQVFITTTNYQGRMCEAPKAYLDEEIAYAQSGNQTPYTFSLKRSSTGYTMSIYPKPDGVYAVQATFYIPQDDLSATTTTISVPADPVWQLALFYAASERGVGLGDDPQRLEARAHESLWAAISEEAELGELTMYED